MTNGPIAGIRDRRVGTSVILAISNCALAFLATRLLATPQEALPTWIWVLSVFYSLTLGPGVFLVLIALATTRDFARGKRLQAVAAAGVGLATAWYLFRNVGL